MFELTTSCGRWKYILISNIITKFKEVASDNMELIKLIQFVIINIQFVWEGFVGLLSHSYGNQIKIPVLW